MLNLARFARRPLDLLLAWHARYGDVFTVRFPGFGTGVYVADLSAIRALFSGDQADLRAGEANSIMEPVVGGHSVLVLDGPQHLRQRRLLLPPFQGAHVSKFRETIREVAEREVSTWRVGERLVVRERMRALTFEVICRAVFGVSEPERVERLKAALMAVMDTGSVFLASRALRADLGPLSPGGRLSRRLRGADVLLYEEIRARRGAADLEQRSDVLSLLLRARDEEGRTMSDEELRDELFTMLAAGHETTATGLAFAVDQLIRDRRVLGRLREELADAGDVYLEATVKEALRMRPVLDAAQRTLAEPREVAGWTLPRGLRVYPAIAVVHHRADLYRRPEAFRPERFIEEGAESYAWLPFGGGVRRCIGAALAQAEMAEVLRVVLGRCELEPERGRPDPVVMRGIILAPKYGVPVRVLRRDPHRGAMPAAGGSEHRLQPARTHLVGADDFATQG